MTDPIDILVVGAGPAGANAALAAARHGKHVVLLDEQEKPGGQVWRAKDSSILSAPQTPEGSAGDALRAQITKTQIDYRGSTRIWQIERQSECWDVHVLKDGEVERLTTKSLVLATGAREFVQPIPGWTKPGVVGLAGATALFKQNLSPPGQRTIVSGTGPLVFFVASEIRRLGGAVAAVITPNTRRDWVAKLPALAGRLDLALRGALWIADLMLSRVPIYWGCAVVSVEGAARVEGSQIQKLDANWAPRGETWKIDADSLCLGYGLIPSIEAAQLSGITISHRPDLGGWVPDIGEDGTTSIDGVFLCGDGAGIRGAAAAELHGTLAGLSAAEYLGAQTAKERTILRPRFNRAARFGLAMTALNMPRPGLAMLTTPDTIVCRCESLTKASISQEIKVGAASINAVKSGLRAGMGPCGGKYCQTAIARLIAMRENRTEVDITPPAPRPPLRPVPVSALSGDFDYNDLPIPKPAPL